VLVNTSRGRLIDENALVDALRAGRLGCAGLDVFEHEPPARDNPLLGLPNVVLTSHAAHWSVESGVEQRFRAVENVALVLSGRPARSPVNAP
jgi:D-3-phosphoglycerate dehydrogenase